MRTERDINERYDGIEQGIMLYAHWKDGVQYVGTCGKTLEQALADIDKEREKELADIRYYNG